MDGDNTGDDLDEDGCPFYNAIDDGVSVVTCTEHVKICNYSYVFHGCSFEDLHCSAKWTCQCLVSPDDTRGRWWCGPVTLPGMECNLEPTRPPRKLQVWGADDDTGLPEPDSTCNPDDPMPKPILNGQQQEPPPGSSTVVITAEDLCGGGGGVRGGGGGGDCTTDTEDETLQI